MKSKQKYIQLLFEALIPVLGFFVWDWSLYFILLFYFIDVLTGEFIVHLKSKKIVAVQGPQQKSSWRSKGAMSFMLLAVSFALVHFAVWSIHPKIDFVQQIVDFWTYTELGVQQGYILLPMVALLGYQQYKMEFLIKGKDRTTELPVVWQKHISTLLAFLGFSGVVLGLSQFIVFHEVVYVLAIVIATGAYNFVFRD